jgi:hypothetical protein
MEIEKWFVVMKDGVQIACQLQRHKKYGFIVRCGNCKRGIIARGDEPFFSANACKICKLPFAVQFSPIRVPERWFVKIP